MAENISIMAVLLTSFICARDDEGVDPTFTSPAPGVSTAADNAPSHGATSPHERAGGLTIEEANNPLLQGPASRPSSPKANSVEVAPLPEVVYLSANDFRKEAEEYINTSNKLPWGRQSVLLRNAQRAFIYTATLAGGIAVIGGSTYLFGKETFTSCGYQEVPSNLTNTFFQTPHTALDFSKITNHSFFNNATNATESFYRIPQLCAAQNPWALAGGLITGLSASLASVSGWFTTLPIFNRESFVDMVCDVYILRNNMKKYIDKNQCKYFLDFACGKYNGYFNASGPFNKEAFIQDLVGWKL